MRYLLLIYLEPGYLSPGDEVARAMNEEYRGYSGWLSESGMLLGGEALQDVTTATSVSVRDQRGSSPTARSRRRRSTSPGYYLIEAADLDAAIDAAARIPGARIGTVEVRPIQELV